LKKGWVFHSGENNNLTNEEQGKQKLLQSGQGKQTLHFSAQKGGKLYAFKDVLHEDQTHFQMATII